MLESTCVGTSTPHEMLFYIPADCQICRLAYALGGTHLPTHIVNVCLLKMLKDLHLSPRLNDLFECQKYCNEFPHLLE